MIITSKKISVWHSNQSINNVSICNAKSEDYYKIKCMTTSVYIKGLSCKKFSWSMTCNIRNCMVG